MAYGSALENFVNGFKSIGDGIRELLHDTPIEIGILAVALGITGGVLGNKWESNRDHKFELAFSEISRVKDEAASKGKEVDVFTLYHASLNDTVMKILEVWNKSWQYAVSPKQAYNNFAENLNRIMTSHEFRHNLSDFLESVPKDADLVLREVAPFLQVRNGIRRVDQLFDLAWDYRRSDNYKTVHYTETEHYTDSEGHSKSRTVHKTKRVYDDSDHYFTYHREHGDAASAELDVLLGRFRDLTLNIDMMIASGVGNENKQAIVESRTKGKEKPNLSPQDYMRLACTWKFGSTIQRNSGIFTKPVESLEDDANTWRSAKGSAKNYHRKTGTTSRPALREYDIAEAAMSQGNSIDGLLTESIEPVIHVSNQIPVLKARIDSYIKDVFYGPKEGRSSSEAKKAANEIKDMACDLYQRSFNAGFEMERYRVGMGILYAFLGLLVGGALGYGVDKGANALGLWGPRGSDFRRKDDFRRYRI